MAIKLTEEEVQLFYNNGFFDEDISKAINEAKENGLTDKQIRKNIDNKIKELGGEVKPEKKGIDLTPSGAYKKAVAGAVAPLRALTHGQTVEEAYNTGLDKLEQFKPAKGAGDFLFDMAIYSKMPWLKNAQNASNLAKIGNFAGNAALQGGVPAALESLKRGGSVAGGASAGTGIAAALQGLTPVAGKVVNKVLKSDAVKKGLPKILEGLTSVPAEYTERALQKELAGESILKGKFNEKTAYRPIEEKLTDSKNILKEQIGNIQNQFKDLGKQVREKLYTDTMPESWYNEQYQNLGNEINKKLQDSIKPESYFDTAYNQLGQRFLSGVENLKNTAGGQLDAVLDKMAGEAQNIGGLKNAVESTINNLAKGGEFNPAELKAGKELLPIRELLNNAETKPINLHNAKEFLYDTANYETTSGIKNNALKAVANQINNYLRKNSDYAAANDKYANILDLVKGIGGDDARTIATKLRDYGTGNSIRSGADSAFRSIEELLPFEHRFMNDLNKVQAEQATQKFLQDNIKQGTLNNIAKYDNLPINEQEMLNYLAPEQIAKYKDLSLQQGQEAFLQKMLPESVLNDISKYKNAPLDVQNTLEQFAPEQLANYQKLANEQDDINNVLKTISDRYLESPRPLADKTSMRFEKAINDIQKRTGINFKDALNDIRAREALEKFFPGQGGGSGSSQGFGNLLRTALIGGSPIAALSTHNPAALLGLVTVSPKITAKGSIKNIGKLSEIASKAQEGAYDKILNTLSQLGAKGASNLLYGGVSYDNYK